MEDTTQDIANRMDIWDRAAETLYHLNQYCHQFGVLPLLYFEHQLHWLLFYTVLISRYTFIHTSFHIQYSVLLHIFVAINDHNLI